MKKYLFLVFVWLMMLPSITSASGPPGSPMPSVTTIISKFANGACTGYLKSDGTCDTPAGTGDMTKLVYDSNDDGVFADAQIATTLTIETISGTPVITNGAAIGTDDTNHLIDEASNGAGSATLYIGNESILASGDIGVSVLAPNGDGSGLSGVITSEADPTVDTADEIIAIVNTTPSTQIGVPAGGMGAGTHTDGGLLVGAGTAAVEALAVGLTTQILVGGGAGTNPAWGTDLPTAVTIGSGYIYRAGGTDVPDADVADDITLTNITQITNRAITSLSATNWRLFYSADGGAPVELALGAAGTVLKSNGAAVAPTFEADETGGTTNYNSIGDPTGVGLITFDDGETATYDGAWDTETAITISLNAADLIGDTVGLLITAVDNDDANYIPFLIQDDQDGTPDDLFKVDYAGVATALGGFVGNVTGNVSGTAATVTGAAQAAITSVGTLTTLTVDDITINGNTISSAGASTLAITPTAGQTITLDGTITIDAGVVAGATSITSTAFVGDLTGNASGTASNLSGTPALPNGTTATTQSASDNSTKLATTAYVDAAAGSPTNITPVDTADENATFYPILVDGATGTQATETDGELTYNPSTGVYTIPQISAGAAGFTVDADGDVVAKSITVDASASPGVTAYDSDSPGADKTAGFMGWQYVDGADGAENSDWLLQIIQAGTLTTVLSFDESGDMLTTSKDFTVTGGDIVLGTTSIFSGGDTASLNNIDAIDATTEATIEAAIDTLANLTSVGAITSSGTITSSGAYDVTGATGMDLGSADVTDITLLGQAEDLALTPSADTWTLSSSTGVTSLNFSALNLTTTGNIQAGITTNTDADGMTQGEMTTAGVRGTMFWAGGAGTWNLPAVAAGMSLCVYSTTAAAVVINPDNADRIVLDGTALADGDSITSASAAGDFICMMYDSAAGWTTLGRSGTWTDTN